MVSVLRRRSSAEVDMTQGNIAAHLLRFALPLLVGNVFQQLYNTVDTWVVGNFVGDTAFSAVGTVGSAVNMLIGFFLGLASGAGVVISQYFGAGDKENVNKTVHVSMLMTLVLGVLFTGLGILLTPYLLRLMSMPEEVYPEAYTYLTIYFSGVLGLMIYNMGAGILRAVGDSRRPLFFLVVSAVVNTLLDLWFVLGFGMGVEGVAYATIIAQGVSAVLVIITLMRSTGCVRFSFRKLRLHPMLLGQILRIGIPTAVQTAITSFSNVFVQSYINYFGKGCMGGWTAYGKIDQLILLPLTSLALASTTFVGQNLGAGQVHRAKRGVRYATLLSVAAILILMLPVMLFAPTLVAFFNRNPEVIAYGTQFLRTLSPFYVLCCFNQIYSGALRGAGDSRTPMFILLFSFVLFRQGYLWVVANFISNTILPISMSYPAGWLVASILTLLYYHHADLGKAKLTRSAPTLS